MALLFILNSTQTIQWAADRYAPQYGFGYKKISGGLLTGLEVEALTFKDDKLLDSLKVGWNPASLLYSRISLTHLEASGLNVEHIKKVAEAFVPTESKEDNSSFVLPVSIAVGELKLNVDPFEESGIGFRDISLEGKGLLYDRKGVDIDELSLSLDTNVTSIRLDGSMQDKDIRIKTLSIVAIDTLAFPAVIKKMIEMNIHKDIMEQVDPEVKKYKSGLEHLLPKRVQIDSYLMTVKPAAHPQIRVDRGEVKAGAIDVDIYGIMDHRPNTIQIASYSQILDTNLSRISMQGKLEDETISIESLSLREIDTLALIKLFDSMENNQTVEAESAENNIAVKSLLPKFLYVKQFDSSIKDMTYGPVVVKSAELNATKVKVNISNFTAESGEFDVAVVSSFASLVQHGVIKDKQLESTGSISTSYAKELYLENVFTLKDGVLDYKGKVIPGQLEGIDNNYTKPLNDLKITYQGDAKSIEARIDSEGLEGKFISTDFKKGDLTLSTKQELELKHFISLPKELNASKAVAELHVPLDFSAILPLHANAKIRSDLATVDADIFYDKALKVISKTIFPEDSLLRAFSPKLNLDALSPLEADFTIHEKSLHMDVRSEGLRSQITFDTGNKNLKGNMILGGAEFLFKGNVEKELSLKNSVSSLEGLLQKISTIYAFDVPPLDGDAKVSLVLTGMKDVALNLKSDTLSYKTEHSMNDTMISLGYADGNVTLNSYRTTFDQQKFFATKPSEIIVKDGKLEIAPLWVNDALKVTGTYNTETQKGEILAFADSFKSAHEKVDLESRIDLKTSFNKGKTSVEGTVTILGGKIHYDMDIKTFSSDRDIVNAEELKKKKSSAFMDNLTTTVKINTEKPFVYKTEEIDMKANADLLIQKAEKGPVRMLGMVEILEGSSYRFQDKNFVLKKSTINFTGDPNKLILDIVATYKTVQAQINIQVTGSPANSNIILSSIPRMSRQKILSTILFGTQTNDEELSEDDMVNMMGGTMAQSVLSNTSAGAVRSAFSRIGINIDAIPFIGESVDANQSKKALFSFFSREEVVIPHHEIHFHGQKNIDKKALQKAMGVDTKSIFAFWKADKPTIKDKLLPTLEQSLRNFYDSKGFYNAAFSIETSKTDVIVNIKENKPVKISDINISSDYDISKLITLKKGQIFRSKEFVSIKKNIIENLLQEGYCSYDLDSKAYVDLEKHQVDVRFKLKKGGVCTFGKVSVKGLESIDDSVVLSRVRAREGERFNIERIRETHDALYDLDAFDSVSVRHDRKFYNVVPIEVTGVEVERPWYVKGDVNYDTALGVRVSAEVLRTNFMGNAKQISLGLAYSDKDTLAELRYFVPALFKISDYYIDLTSKIGYSTFKYTGFREEEVFAKVFLSYNDEKLSLNAGFAIENIDISLRKYPLVHDMETGNFSPAYPFLNFVYDSRDAKLDPKNGYYIGGEVEYGLPYNDEASTYLKWSLEGRVIHTFSDLTLSAVAKAGIVDKQQNDIPESKLFFAGGVNSNRAYGYKRVGVIYSPTRYGIDGGATMSNLSLEANYPINDDLYAAVFSDNTMLARDAYDFSGDVLSSAGLGVRYITPIGPIKLDMGMNVHDTSEYALHFQIGQSF